MKKLRKILLVIIAAIVILAVVAAVLVNLFADRVVKTAIEAAASKALNVGVTIDSLDLSILGGKVALDNLLIKNPPGYQHDNLLQLRNTSVVVDIRSLLGDVVNIKEIKLDGAEVVLEQRGVSGNNLQDVLKSIPTSPKSQEPAQPSGKKLHIDTLELSDVRVMVKLLPVPGKADTVTLKLAPIKMTNLGGDNKLDTAALAGKILVAIAEGVAEQGAGILPDDMVGAMKSTLAKTAELGKEAIKTAEDLGKGLTEGLKGLLKPKKQE